MLDANNLPDHQHLTTQLCIVGAGAAGIALALELAGSGIEVLMLEAGGFERPAPSSGESADDGRERKPADPAGWHAFGGHAGRHPVRCRMLTGHELAHRPWIPDSGWPLAPEDLAPYYLRARALCEPPATASLIDATVGTPLIDGLGDRDFDCRLSDRYAAAGDFGARHGARLAADSHLTVIGHATVTALRLNAAGSAATTLSVRTDHGATLTVHARTVVIAAGALETARLLLASREVHAAGIGNGRGHVGRYLLATLRGSLGTVNLTRPLPPAWQGSPRHPVSRRPLLLSDEAQTRHQLPAFALRLRPVPADDLLSRTLSRLRRQPQSVWKYRIDWQCEQLPTAACRALLVGSDADRPMTQRLRLEWQPGAGDIKAVRRSLGLFDEALRRGDAGTFDHDPGALADALMPAVVPIEHLLGGARMGGDPRQSVTDPRGRVHGIDSLFVTGSALFPTSGLDNPLLTLVALSLRLADHLKSREQRHSASVISLHDHLAARHGSGPAAGSVSAAGARRSPAVPDAGDAD